MSRVIIVQNKFMLITGRSKNQAISMESEGKFSRSYFDAVAVAYMNPHDCARLGINSKARVYLDDSGKSIVIHIKRDYSIPEGIIYIPLSPWANSIIPASGSMGMPNFKGIEIFVEPVNDNADVTSLEDLMKNLNKRPIYLGKDLEIKNGGTKHYVKALCTFCGLVCDNIVLGISGNTITDVLDGCAISLSKFTNSHKNRIVKPVMRTPNGNYVEIDLATAINKTIDILVSSKHPLIYGLACTSNEAIEIAIEIARMLRGTIDSTASVCHGPTILSLDGVNTNGIKFNDLRDFDIVVIWGANPIEAHPKLIHILRKISRTIVVIDVRESETMKIADVGIIVKPGRDIELIRTIRAMIKGYHIDRIHEIDIDIEHLRKLVESLKKAKRGAVFVGVGLTMNRTRYVNTLELALMVSELRAYGEWYLQPLRGHFNVTGTNILMKNLTGHPYAIDFLSTEPMMFPGVTTAVDLLRNGDVDAVLVIASDPATHMPADCVRSLAKLPLIVIDARWSITASIADIVIPSGFTGIECSGSVYRMDGEHIRVPSVISTSNETPCDVDVLRTILDGIKKRLGYTYEQN